MPTSVAEITYFKASEAYNSDSSSLDGAKGLRKSYIGNQTEEEAVLLVNDWDSKEACDAFSNRPGIAEAYPPPPTSNYVEFDNTKGPLGAPITEFVTFTLKEGKKMAELEPLVEKLHQRLAGTEKFHGDSWGRVIGKDDVYYGILGWDSVKAHWDAVADGPLKEVIDQVKQIADLWLVHAALKASSA